MTAFATAASSVPGIGDLTHEARIIAISAGSASTQNRSTSDETPIGVAMTAAQAGAGSVINLQMPLPRWFVRKFRGAELGLIGTMRITSGFMSDKGFNTPSAPVAITYNDGSASANLGTLVSNGVDPADATVFRREASILLTDTIATVGLYFQIPASAVANNPHSVRVEGFSICCTAVPVGAAYSAADVSAALRDCVVSLVDIGDVHDNANWSAVTGGGAVQRSVAGRSVGITIPAGNRGDNSQITASFPLDPAWRGKLAGSTIRGSVLVDHSVGFSRDLVLRLFQGGSQVGGSLANTEVIQITPTRRLYTVRGFTTMTGNETSIALLARQLGTPFNANATSSDEFFEISAAWIKIADPGASALLPSEASGRIADARLRSELATNAAAIAALNARTTTSVEGIRASLRENDQPAGVVARESQNLAGIGLKTYAAFADVGTSPSNLIAGRRYRGLRLYLQAPLGAVMLKVDIYKRSLASAALNNAPGAAGDLVVQSLALTMAEAGLTPSAGTTITGFADVDITTDFIAEAGYSYGWHVTMVDATDVRTTIGVGRVAVADAGLPVRLRGFAGTGATGTGSGLGSGSQQLAAEWRAERYFNAVANAASVDQLRNDVNTLMSGGGAAPAGLSRVLLVVDGQSNEQGPVLESDREAYPLAFASARNRAVAGPFGPRSGAMNRGGWWYSVYDRLHEAGFDLSIVNGAIGSQSFVRHGAGVLLARANNAAYYQTRNPAFPDRGYRGDFMVREGKVFRCSVGRQLGASYAPPFPWTNGQPNLDYIGTVGAQATAASDPGGWSVAAVGSSIVDGTVTWSCVGDTTSGDAASNVYFGLVAGSVFTERQKGVGFDPLGIMHSTYEAALSAAPGCVRKIVYMQNGQGDIGYSAAQYQAALEAKAAFWLQRGFEVMIGLTCYMPAAGATAYSNLQSGRGNALTVLRSAWGSSRVHDGANLFSAMGTTGPMASGGAFLQADNVHLNGRGAVGPALSGVEPAARHVADAIRAVL